MPPVSELTFRRAIINLADAGRLGEGEDLNDAILDFFIRLGQWLIPAKGDEEVPVSYLGSIFWKQLRSAYSTSGEDGWKNVMNWAKRKAGGLFKNSYGAFAVPINEDLKDDKGQDAGNHWWLAMVLNPAGGAKKEPIAVMCLDSMQRRTKKFDPPLETEIVGSLHKYTLEVTDVEQAGYLIIISFDARGDGTFGPLPRPEKSQLLVDGYACVDPQLGLKINMPGGDDVPGRFQGVLTFALDGRCRSSVFQLQYAEGGYGPIKLEFDPFQLTRLQKDVSRYLGGYLAKEWEVNGPAKSLRFEKQAARALVADVHQQENLNDCGVYVLENTLRSLRMSRIFLKTMAEASSDILSSYPWPCQKDITSRKEKLKGIVARLFAVAAEKGTADVEKLLKDDDELKKEVVASLTDEGGDQIEKFANTLHKELAARQADKEKSEVEVKRKEELVQARREEDRVRREEEAKKAEEDRLEAKRRGDGPRKNPTVKKARSSSSSSSSSASRSPSRNKRNDKAKGRQPAKGRRGSSDDSDDSRRGRKSAPAKRSGGRDDRGRDRGKKRGRDDSRSRSHSRRRRR